MEVSGEELRTMGGGIWQCLAQQPTSPPTEESRQICRFSLETIRFLSLSLSLLFLLLAPIYRLLVHFICANTQGFPDWETEAWGRKWVSHGYTGISEQARTWTMSHGMGERRRLPAILSTLNL
jgi:hypothetical protein